jgi:hypothetical protein
MQTPYTVGGMTKPPTGISRTFRPLRLVVCNASPCTLVVYNLRFSLTGTGVQKEFPKKTVQSCKVSQGPVLELRTPEQFPISELRPGKFV